MEFKFNVGDNVIYNPNNESSKFATIFKKRANSTSPCYLIYKIEDKSASDMIPETKLTACTIDEIINHFWDIFVYDGDNLKASNFIINNILKNVGNANNISWGPNKTNTMYTLKIQGKTPWLKNTV